MSVKHEVLTKDGLKEVNLTPMKAIRLKCLECANFQWSEVRDCNILDCALYVYRFGRNPRENETKA